MSQLVQDPAEKRQYLQNTLAYEPTHPEARRALAVLDGKLKPEEIVNPNDLPAFQSQRPNAERFTCPKCGGRMVFRPDGRSLHCEYCARGETLQTTIAGEQDFVLKMATAQAHRAPMQTPTFACQGCGAQFVLPPQEISASCSYCGSNHVLRSTREATPPDSILPIRVDFAQAVQNLIQWVQKRGIEPSGKVQPPRAVYLPLWTFDIVGNIPWSGYVTRNKRQERVEGEKLIHFDDILVPGAPKQADILPKITAGFNTNAALPYDSRYLAGWLAELPQMSLAEASLDAREQAAHRARRLISQEQSNLPIQYHTYSTANVSVSSFKLLLVPVWLTALPYEGRSYRLLMNGVNGDVFCELPERGIAALFRDLFGV
jgi:hypothetical protein